MGLKELSKGNPRKDVFGIDPHILKIEEGWNIRTDGPEKDAHIRTLADSIKAAGVRRPLLVRAEGESLYVVDGECRLRATLLAISEGASIPSIPCMSEDRYSTPADRNVSMLVENEENLPLTMLQKGEGMKRLLSHGYTETRIASEIGKSVTHVKTCLNLTTVSPEILTMVQDGKVSATTALKVVKEKGQNEAVDVLKDAVGVSAAMGKKKATARHLDRKPGELNIEAKVNWKKWGPKLKFALEAIVTCPAVGKGSERMGDYLAQGNEILSLMEDER